MALTDELKFSAKAGNGGDGVVRWRHEKFIDKGGPNGGDGGWGGNVYITASRDTNLLGTYKKAQKKFVAGNGAAGQGQSKHGANGKDVEIALPIGSVVTNVNTGEKFEILKDEDRFMVLAGGKGGYGNEHFKSSLNVSPLEVTEGKPGETAEFYVELKIIADIGLVGFPNAGKSSMLNILTNAKSKVGNYDFTTLDPHLGMYHGFIIADIPGLIEGANEGRGLGAKFLKHISRTRAIVHLISAENPDVVNSYKTIRNELKSYDSGLENKNEVIVISKVDMLDPTELAKKIKELEKITKKPVYSLSLYDDKLVKNFGDILIKELKNN
jgi:GTP-binding protein